MLRRASDRAVRILLLLGLGPALVALVGGAALSPAWAQSGSDAHVAATPGGVSVPLSGDALDQALAVAGLSRRDLGWEARGWWQRYPQDIPHKLRHFDDLCAEPLAIVPFVRAMGATVTQTLAPERVAGEEGDRGAGALYVAVHNLGVNKRYGATRAYSANLTAEPTPLAEALLACWEAGDRATRFVTFGQVSPYPQIARDLEIACEALPSEVSEVLGKLVLDLLDARQWVRLSFRNVDLESRVRIASRLDLGAEETDALEYEPAMDDAAAAWDEASLWYAGLKTVEALDLARLALADPVAARASELRDLDIQVATPVGLVLIGGTGGNTYRIPDGGAFLVVDLGGDDRCSGPLGASRPTCPVGAALDLGGADTYEANDAALGAGVTGIGVLLDAAGDDDYSAATLAAGAGHFGLGALIDIAGDDRYAVSYSGQGAGFFGIGLLLDLAGDDRYTIWSDGQGFGGVGGVGVLADREGNDEYVAVADPGVTGRPSYHTELGVAVSNAQGCAMGRRGDGADGHSWAGGLGALLDASGDDRYAAGNWAQGCGYWFGTGVVWDGAGDDEYRANGWASASGAHFCIGAVIDEAGDDIHAVAQNWGPAFGHDFTVALLLDAGGNDLYECGSEGVGHSINRSVALCLEGGGNDRYVFATAGKRPGLATFHERMLDRRSTSVYWTESISVGLCLDAGGLDRYEVTPGDGGENPPDAVSGVASQPANDLILTDAPGSENARARNRGIFVDREGGAIDLDRPQGGSRR